MPSLQVVLPRMDSHLEWTPRMALGLEEHPEGLGCNSLFGGLSAEGPTFSEGNAAPCACLKPFRARKKAP